MILPLGERIGAFFGESPGSAFIRQGLFLGQGLFFGYFDWIAIVQDFYGLIC